VIIISRGIDMSPNDLALYIEAKLQGQVKALKYDHKTSSFEVV